MIQAILKQWPKDEFDLMLQAWRYFICTMPTSEIAGHSTGLHRTVDHCNVRSLRHSHCDVNCIQGLLTPGPGIISVVTTGPRHTHWAAELIVWSAAMRPQSVISRNFWRLSHLSKVFLMTRRFNKRPLVCWHMTTLHRMSHDHAHGAEERITAKLIPLN